MSLLGELNGLLTGLGLPVETGVFSGEAPDEYAVITPMTDEFILFADDAPRYETSEARVSLYSKNNYQNRKNQITAALIENGFTITERRYIGYEDNTTYHHYAIDTAKYYAV